MVKYVYLPHFCLLIYPQDQWNEKEQKIVCEQLTSKFRSFIENNPWDEKDRDELTLFNPQKPENNPAMGAWGIISPCVVCDALIPTFVDKQGNKQGLILFSHSQLLSTDLVQFLEFLLNHAKIKKVLILSLDEINITGKMSSIQALKWIPKGQLQSCNLTEMKNSITQKGLQSGILYEIRKDKF